MKTNYYVYILQCGDNSFYTGITNNLERRLKQHQAGINPDCYTFTRRPLHLVYYEIYIDPKLAIEHEKKIKRWSRKKKIALINKEW
ncbi:MAG: GIY-YIG nuclease family protein [Bacteroidota bacterium]|nr:GIY-YIG nuclease family protein [Bacteroidota bacterium]